MLTSVLPRLPDISFPDSIDFELELRIHLQR